MHLRTVRIQNCFGFRDTTIDLGPSLLYVLGRNSSGKTSLLDSISNLAPRRVPADHPRFKNFRHTGTPLISGEFEVTAAPPLVSSGAIKALLLSKGVAAPVQESDPELLRVLAELDDLYTALSRSIATRGFFTLTKLSDGGCQIAVGDDVDLATQRREAVDHYLQQLLPNGILTAGGTKYEVRGFNTAAIERALVRVPNISYYVESYNLTDDLPDFLTLDTVFHPQNSVTAAFVILIGADDAESLLTTNDPDEQDRLREVLQRRLNALAAEIARDATRLVDMTISPTANGLQLTMRTDGKKSFYRHLSDATKFLVAYQIYAREHGAGSILLFDEPSRGLHASAEPHVRLFLEKLAAENHVIVATHSQYLLDIARLDRVRLMQQDLEGRPVVVNTLRPPRDRKGYLLALQPVFDAIGLAHAQQVLTRHHVVLTEGLTDYLYVIAFMRLASVTGEYTVTPGRGDATLLTLVPFMLSQGVALKIILDGERVKTDLQVSFGIPEDAFLIVGSADSRCAGIEDVFSRSDYLQILENAGYAVTDTDLSSGNGTYAKQTDKRLVAQAFLNDIDGFTLADFDDFTQASIRQILTFCDVDSWWRLEN